MKVELIRYTPDGEKLIASCAKLCYSQSGVSDIEEALTPEKTTRFLDMLMEIGHASPVEHVSFTFAVEGVSRALTHQLVRHRIASFSQQSQRYVRVEDFHFVTPPSIAHHPEAKAYYEQSMQRVLEEYNTLTSLLMEEKLKRYREEGLEEKVALRRAEKESIEDARYIFPNATETKIVFTMNARSLMNFFHHRCCQRAQWEIREMATQMLRLVYRVYPTLFRTAGPSCVGGPCPEGKMTCGRIREVREMFSRYKSGSNA